MKIIIAGSREFNNYRLLKSSVDYYLKNVQEPIIVSGTAKGADRLGERYAKENGYEILRYPAKWKLYDLAAGYIRNEEMAKIADACILFWDGKSKGTKHMKEISEKYNLRLRIVEF